MMIHLAVDDKARRSSRHDDAGSFPRRSPTIGPTIVPTVINKTNARKKSYTKLLLLKWAFCRGSTVWGIQHQLAKS